MHFKSLSSDAVKYSIVVSCVICADANVDDGECKREEKFGTGSSRSKARSDADAVGYLMQL
jgi:hypothetical protein